MDNIGVYIEDDVKNKDFDLRDYIIDSLQYIALIVNLETELGICYPDEMLVMDVLGTFEGFCSTIEVLMSCQNPD